MVGNKNMCLHFMSSRFFTFNEIRDSDNNLPKGPGNKKRRVEVAQAKDIMTEYLNR